MERHRRFALWQQLTALRPDELTAKFLRDLRIYGGAQGIWVDREVTGNVSPDVSSVTVSILHTGDHYPDDVSQDAIIYHYPQTNRSPGRDRSEIEATKATRRLNLPLFVILGHATKAELRVVKLAWVADWDDESNQFLILFGEEPQNLAAGQEQDAAFQLQTARERRTAQVQVRIGQQKFRFAVLKSYGPKCSVCPIAVPQLLAAAHICGKEHNGSDDWRNGIPLCHSHHAAFDAQLFSVDPESLVIQVADGLSFQELAITETMLKTIHARPHREALQWRINRTCKNLV
jgi:hypothetical protein